WTAYGNGFLNRKRGLNELRTFNRTAEWSRQSSVRGFFGGGRGHRSGGAQSDPGDCRRPDRALLPVFGQGGSPMGEGGCPALRQIQTLAGSRRFLADSHRRYAEPLRGPADPGQQRLRGI